MEQKIESPTEQEIAWIAMQLKGASKFIGIYLPSESDDSLSLAKLDRAFALWLKEKETKSEIVNAVINRVGVAFGQHLVDNLGFKWVVASDKQSVELAVYALPGNGDVLKYPANLVAKRWERGEIEFLEPSYDKIAAQVKRL